MFRSLYRIRHPELYQGPRKKRRYFEGWYFKQVSSDGRHAWAVIPGISRDAEGGGHAFIQLIDGSTGATRYHREELSAFSSSDKCFDIRIGGSRFTCDGFHLDFDDENRWVKADITCSDLRRLPSTPAAPGIMGWYSYVPFMECYHGLISLDHRIEGSLSTEAGTVDFTGGRGYMEKDWGRSFPSSWIWLQSNTFPESGVCISFSVARIPWLGGAFTGFLCVLLYRDRIVRFATYTGARLESVAVTGNEIGIEITDGEYRLTLATRRSSSGILKAPADGGMDRRIAESIDAAIDVTLKSRTGGTLFSGTGRNGGAEIVGDIGELMPSGAGARSSRR